MECEQIGILAGGGQFPRLVAEGAKSAGFGVVICGFTGHADEGLAEVADAFRLFSIGQFGAILKFLHSRNVKRLCMAGAVSKPNILELRPDALAMKLLFSLRNNRGDDALLRGIIKIIEDSGISVVGAADLVPSLRCPAGVLGRVKPSEKFLDAVAFGWPRLALTGRLDIGQCMVVREGMVVALECLEGTDATLRRAADMNVAGCVALKMAKPGQEERADLPSVGLKTIEMLIKGKYSGLVVEAEKTLFFDRERVLALADKNNLCIMALTAEESAKLIAAHPLPL